MPAHIKSVLVGPTDLASLSGASQTGRGKASTSVSFATLGARRVFVTLNGTSRSEQFGD